MSTAIVHDRGNGRIFRTHARPRESDLPPRPMARLDLLKAQLGGPRDGALLRYSLGAALLDAADAPEAVTQLRAALAFDPGYSAAWKLLGKACLASGDEPAAAGAWEQGIAAAQARGEVQAAKEMQVFAKRLARKRPD